MRTQATAYACVSVLAIVTCDGGGPVASPESGLFSPGATTAPHVLASKPTPRPASSPRAKLNGHMDFEVRAKMPCGSCKGQALVPISLMRIGEGRIYWAVVDDAAICSVANRLGEMGGALLATVYWSYTAQPIEQRCHGVMHQPRTMGLIGYTRTPNRRRDRNAQLAFS